MGVFLLFYFVVCPWVAFLCVLAKRSFSQKRAGALAQVVFSLSLAIHGLVLVGSLMVGLSFAAALGSDVGWARVAVFSAGFLTTCLGHVGVLVSLVRPLDSRLKVASIAALPAGWLLTALVVAVRVAGQRS